MNESSRAWRRPRFRILVAVTAVAASAAAAAVVAGLLGSALGSAKTQCRLVLCSAKVTAFTAFDLAGTVAVTVEESKPAIGAISARWPVIYSVNLGYLSATEVTSDARAVAAALGGHLTAIACGNEPDGYVHRGYRPGSYTEDSYLKDAAACVKAVHRSAPDARIAGPDTFTTSWPPPYAAAEKGTISLLTEQYYPLSNCHGGGATPATLLSASTSLLFAHLLGTGSLLRVTVKSAARIAAHAVRAADGTIRVLIENLTSVPKTISLKSGNVFGHASVLHPVGPFLTATGGIRIQGAFVRADGTFSPGAPSRLTCQAGSCGLRIAADSVTELADIRLTCRQPIIGSKPEPGLATTRRMSWL